MNQRRERFASEAQALRRLADELPGRGVLTLLGAPLLAVVATFWLQPKAIGSEPTTLGAPALQTEYAASNPGLRAAAASPGPIDPAGSPPPHEQSEPFLSIAHAIDAGEWGQARALLTALPEANESADREGRAREGTKLAALGQGYQIVLDCLEHPNNDTTARALHFYLEGAPEALRPRLRAACLQPSGNN